MQHIISYKDYKFLNESLNTAKQKYGSSLGFEYFEKAKAIDPSKTFKYLELICRFILEYLKLMDETYGDLGFRAYKIRVDEGIKTFLNDLKERINIFNDGVSKGILKGIDINNPNYTYNDFYDDYKKVKDFKTKTEIKKITKEGAEVVFENDYQLILLIKTHDACKLYGASTKWCITQDNASYWRDYSYEKNTTFYFVINKNKEERDLYKKIAVQVPEEDYYVFWDTSDQQHTTANIVNNPETGITRETLEYFKYIPKTLDDMNPKDVFNALGIEKWNYNPTKQEYNIDGSVDISHNRFVQKYKKIPIKFGIITGSFNCSDCNLLTLENAPRIVNYSFDCSYNQIRSLAGGPTQAGSYLCNDNQLSNLKGAPTRIDGNFFCSRNWLESLEGLPKSIGEDLYIRNNKDLKITYSMVKDVCHVRGNIWI